MGNLPWITLKVRGIAVTIGCLAFTLALPGCGPSLVHVKGKLTRSGRAVQIGPRQFAVLTFVRLDDEGLAFDSFGAAFNPADSTFDVPGRRKHRGIPKGRYRIAFEQKRARGEKDVLRGEFNPKTSPIVREIKKSGEINIDLDHPMQQ